MDNLTIEKVQGAFAEELKTPLDKVIKEFNGRLYIQQCKDELQGVLDYLEEQKKGYFNHFVEVGSSNGGSLWIYTNLLVDKGGKVTSLEIKFKSKLMNTVKRLKDRGYKIECKRPPCTVQNIDLLHIDGWHHYDAVRADFDTYFPKVVKGGVVLIHDTLLWAGCIKLREELEKKYKCNTFRGYDLLSKYWGKADSPDKAEHGDRNSTGITVLIKE